MNDFDRARDLASELDAMRAAAYADRLARAHARNRDVMLDRREHLMSVLRPIRAREYNAWLTGYMLAGGKPTHFYDYPMPTDRWFTATADVVVLPLHGALAVTIFVPAGVRDLGGDTGHTTLFIATDAGEFLWRGFHDTVAHRNGTVVPVFTDTEVMA